MSLPMTGSERSRWDPHYGRTSWSARREDEADRRPKVKPGIVTPARLAELDEEPSRRTEQGKALAFVRAHGIPHRLTFASAILEDVGQMRCSACGKIKAVTMDGELYVHKIAGQNCPGSPTGNPLPVVVSSLLLKGNGWGILTEDGKLRRAMSGGRFVPVAEVHARLALLASS